MNEIFLTVLTPTYNRATTIGRVFESLMAQNTKDVEWIVVDDGSDDETQALVTEFSERANFPVRYIHKENGGKASAVNLGMGSIRGKYTILLDSDDALLPKAVEHIKGGIEATGFDGRPDVSQIHFLSVDDFDRPNGPPFPDGVTVCDQREMMFRYRRTDEQSVIFKSSILKQFPLYEIQPPEHVPESVTWNKMAARYKAVYVSDLVRKYFQHDGIDRLSTGAGAEQKTKRATVRWPKGKYLWALSSLNYETAWFRYNPSFFFKRARNMVRYGLHIGHPLARQWSELQTVAGRVLWLVFLGPGILKFRHDKASTNTPTASQSVT